LILLSFSGSVRFGVNHVFSSLKGRKSSEKEVLMLSEHSIILDRVAKASNLFHKFIGACESNSKGFRFLMVVSELREVELVRARVGVVICDLPFVHMAF